MSALRFPAVSGIHAATILALWLNGGLVEIAGWILVFRAATLMLQLFVTVTAVPGLARPRVSVDRLRRMMRFGVWVTVSRIIDPLMFYLDRLAIGTTLGVAAVAYYATPFELTARLWLLSTSLAGPLTVAVARLDLTRDAMYGRMLVMRSIKYLVLTTGVIAALVGPLAGPLLDVWVGAELALASTTTFQLLLLSTVIELPGAVASCFLEGVGRPEVAVKVKLVYLPLYGLLSFGCVRLAGIEGAAIALLVLRIGYVAAFGRACARLLGITAKMLVLETGVAVGLVCSYAGLGTLGHSLLGPTGGLMLAAALLVPSAFLTYFYVLASDERDWVHRVASGLASRPWRKCCGVS